MGPVGPMAAKALARFVSAVGSGVVGAGVARTMSTDQEQLAFDQLLADVRAICRRQGGNPLPMNSTLFRFSRSTQAGSTEYVLLEFNKADHSVLVSVTSTAGRPVMHRRAISPTFIMNSYLPGHTSCSAPTAVIRPAP